MGDKELNTCSSLAFVCITARHCCQAKLTRSSLRMRSAPTLYPVSGTATREPCTLLANSQSECVADKCGGCVHYSTGLQMPKRLAASQNGTQCRKIAASTFNRATTVPPLPLLLGHGHGRRHRFPRTPCPSPRPSLPFPTCLSMTRGLPARPTPSLSRQVRSRAAACVGAGACEEAVPGPDRARWESPRLTVFCALASWQVL